MHVDYNVVMTHPLSVRFHRPEVVERLKAEAASRRLSTSALAEELIEEGLRLRRHPLIVFRDGPSGRRAGLIDGPDVWEVVGGIVGGDVPVEDRVARAVEIFGLGPERVAAALDYYAAYPEEVDDAIAANIAAAEESEEMWRRRRQLLAG
jgi:hypothetical protein